MFIDSHTHLYAEEFDADRHEVVTSAIENGVKHLLLPNIDLSSFQPMLDMVSEYPGICFPMLGLHPGSVKSDYQNVLGKVYEGFSSASFVAIGEVGIDLYWDKTFLKEQEDAFRIQIGWAKEKKLPLVIHSRESFGEIFKVLESEWADGLQGVFHSFTGGEEELARIQEFDFYIGINGIVSFKNSNLKELIPGIPINRLLIETDSPYLAPVPRRGRRNESAFLVHTAEKIAEILGIPLSEVAEQTSSNAKNLFNLK